MSQTEVFGLAKEHVWDQIAYEPHDGQVVIHSSAARHRVASCGRRFGKSVLGGNELVPEALLTYTLADELRKAGKRREFWIVGPEYSDAEKEFRQVWNRLEYLEVDFDRPGSYNNPENGDLHISLWKGAFEIHGKSAKYPQTLVGEGLSGCILAEAAKLKERVWTKFIRPTLADQRGWSLHTSTPEGKNWFYRMWQRGQVPDTPWQSWRMPSWVNNVVFPVGATKAGLELLRMAAFEPEPGLNVTMLLKEVVERGLIDEEIVDMALDMTEERFNQEIGADFSEFVGRVFKDFDEEVHVRTVPYNPKLPLYLALDYGWTNPFVCLFIQVDIWDNVYVVGEYRRIHRDIEDIAADLVAHPYASKAKVIYPDPAEPGDTAVLEKKLKVKANGATGGELKWRLELIRQRLKIDHRKLDLPGKVATKLIIDRSCKELIREMNDYRYPESKDERKGEAPEKPMDKDDHGPEALGRFFRGYYGGPADNAGGRARVRKPTYGTGGRK